MPRIEYMAETCAGVIAARGMMTLSIRRPNIVYVRHRVVADMGDKCLACSAYRGYVDVGGISIAWMGDEGDWLPMDGTPLSLHGHERLRLLILQRPGSTFSNFLCRACLPIPQLSHSELDNMHALSMRAEKRLFDEVINAYNTPGSYEEHEVLDQFIDEEVELEDAIPPAGIP